MKIHLTSIQFEQFILEPSATGEEVLEHLQNCPLCQKELDTCRIFLSKLKHQKEESFEFDLSLLILTRLEQPQPAPKEYKQVYVFLSLFLIGLPAIYFSVRAVINSDTITLSAIWLIVISSLIVLIGLGLEHYRNYTQRLVQLN